MKNKHPHAAVVLVLGLAMAAGGFLWRRHIALEAAASGPDPWVHEHWESGLPGYPDAAAGYFLYNLEEREEGWDALVVWPLQWAYLSGPEAPPVYKTEEEGFLYAACQRVRAERQGGRWVVLPQGDFWVEATQTPSSSATGLSRRRSTGGRRRTSPWS